MRPLHEVLIEAASRKGVSQSTRRSALALAAAAPAAFGLNSVLAQVDAERNGKGKGKGKGKNRGRRNHGGSRQGDIRILNFALTLEHLEYAFYRDALANDFTRKSFGGFLDPNLYDRLLNLRDHEDTHVDALTATIQDLGGEPVEELCYDFGYTTVTQFLGVAQALENTGVSAYVGAIADIKSPSLQTTGATIATVEARHASYLNLINRVNPFPDAFDEPLDMDEVLAIAGQFIVGEMPCN